MVIPGPVLASWPRLWQWAVLVGAGLVVGAGFRLIHLPAALMLGPLLVGAIMALRGATVRVPRTAHRFCQGVAGCLIALNLDADVLHRMAEIWPVIIGFVVLTFAAACAAGLAAAAWTGIDREVSIWGFLPGMAGTMIAIAHERGLDSRMVAFMQILRLLVVIAGMVAAAMVLVGPARPPSHGLPHPDLPSTMVVIGLCLAGIAAGRWLAAVPAGASLVPLMLAAGLSLSGVNVAMPGWLLVAGYLGLGAQVGLRCTPELLRTGYAALPALLAACLLLMFLCGLSGVALSWIAGVDVMSGVLATVPGSIDSIAIVAIGSGADMAFVMTLQTVRLFAVALAGPAIAVTLVRFAGGPQATK